MTQLRFYFKYITPNGMWICHGPFTLLWRRLITIISFLTGKIKLSESVEKSVLILILRQFFYMSHTTIISAAATLFKAWQRLFYTRPLKGDRSKMVLWRHELCRPILVIIVIIHCSSSLLFCVLLTRHLLCFLYSAAFCYCSTPHQPLMYLHTTGHNDNVIGRLAKIINQRPWEIWY